VSVAAADAFTHTDTETGSVGRYTGAFVVTAVFAVTPGCNVAELVPDAHFSTPVSTPAGAAVDVSTVSVPADDTQPCEAFDRSPHVDVSMLSTFDTDGSTYTNGPSV
jgi:hypothetical protein